MEVYWIFWPFWLPSFVPFPDTFCLSVAVVSMPVHSIRGVVWRMSYILSQNVLDRWSWNVCLSFLTLIRLSLWLEFIVPLVSSLWSPRHQDLSQLLVSKHTVLFPFDIVYTVGSLCPICMTLHLSMLKESNHFFDHSINKFRSCCKNSLSSMSLILVQIFVSSANIIRLHLTQSGRLVLWRFWNRNRNRDFNPQPNRNLQILWAN